MVHHVVVPLILRCKHWQVDTNKARESSGKHAFLACNACKRTCGSSSLLLRVAGSAVQVGEIVALGSSVRVSAVVHGAQLLVSLPFNMLYPLRPSGPLAALGKGPDWKP